MTEKEERLALAIADKKRLEDQLDNLVGEHERVAYLITDTASHLVGVNRLIEEIKEEEE